MRGLRDKRAVPHVCSPKTGGELKVWDRNCREGLRDPGEQEAEGRGKGEEVRERRERERDGREKKGTRRGGWGRDREGGEGRVEREEGEVGGRPNQREARRRVACT